MAMEAGPAVAHLHEVPLCQLLITYFPVSRAEEMEGELGTTTQRGFELPPIEPTQCRHGQNNAEITVGCKVQ